MNLMSVYIPAALGLYIYITFVGTFHSRSRASYRI